MMLSCEKVMGYNSRECFFSIQTGDCHSTLMVVTERGSFSVTTVSKRQHLQRRKWMKGYNLLASALPQEDMIAEQQQVEAAAPLKAPTQSQVYLVDAFGWRVRDLNPRKQKDLHNVALIQTEAFHNPSLVFNQFFYDLFKAEVLTALTYKVRLSPPRRYTCLVAEAQESNKMIGAVDLTALDNKDVLQYLPGADEYLYVSGLAVEADYRRKNVGKVLLQGVEVRAMEWGFKHLALHAYEDDEIARMVYTKAGYEVVGAEPLWKSSLIGKRRRVVMTKSLF